MAHKKAGGSSRNGRDSDVSAWASSASAARRSYRAHPGSPARHQDGRRRQCRIGRDHTLFATADGVVSFRTRSGGKVEVNVIPPARWRE